MLTNRRIEIFKAIVDEHIKTAEPVSSKALQEKFHLPYSSATIRNDMQVLEEMGYLEKTHTSSGRIPSTFGYKFYCENLLDHSGLDRRMEIAIKNAFEVTGMNLDEAVRQSCQILSEMTNMTTGAIGPTATTEELEHIKLFPIDERNAVCIFITNTGHTETKKFHFEEDISMKDLENCTEILNNRLRNTPLTELVERMHAIHHDMAQIVRRHDILFTAFVKAFIKFASDNVYFSGRERMMYQPEFEDIDKLKKLMNLLDDSTIWRDIDREENAIAVRTTRGTALTWLNDVAIVRSTFHLNENQTGQLMVVGPSRMDYDRVVAMLSYTAQMIEKMYNSGGRGKNDE